MLIMCSWITTNKNLGEDLRNDKDFLFKKAGQD
jgi:hypothetical protein